MGFSPPLLFPLLAPYVSARRWLVGFSGGLDSTVLLHSLVALSKRESDWPPITAVHVHHGLNAEANSWAQHCVDQCAALGVSCVVSKVKVAGNSNIESEARTARYQAFERELQPEDVLLLGHHLDDQVETQLLRLMRGAGLVGVAGMDQSRALGQAQLFRPLLGVARSDLEAYALAAGLSWVEDDSNADQRFDRNYVRHRVLPLLAERWPGYSKSLLRHAATCRDTDASLNFFLDRQLAPMADLREMPLTLLEPYPEHLKINLLRRWLQCGGLPLPSKRQLQAILQEVVYAGDDAKPLVTWSGAEVRRYQGVLYGMQPLPDFDPETSIVWNMVDALDIPGNGGLVAEQVSGEGFSASRINGEALVSFRQGGERCQPRGRGGSRPLKKLLQEYSVAPWLRDRVPLIYVEGQLAAVAGQWICQDFAADSGEPGYKFRWSPP